MRPLTALLRRGLAVAVVPLALAACAPRQVPAPAGPGSPVVLAPTAAPVQPTVAPVQPTVAPVQPTVAPAQPTAAPAQPTAAPAQPTVAPAPQPGAPQRISFAPGATSASVEGAVIRGERAVYVLWAAAGQQMSLQLATLEQNGAIVVTGPDGRPLPGAAPGQDAAAWSGALPATGDYTVEVGPTRGNATYRLSVSITTPAAPAGSIRSTDWGAALAADPNLEQGQQEGRLSVAVRGADPGVGGMPLLDTVLYGDFDGDGREDAAITLNSGGTAGNVGLLVFRDTGAGPALAAWRDGYKLSPAAEGGLLVVREPIYAFWEPNCCPSGLATMSYALRPAGLELVAQRSEGVAGAEPEVVRAYYDLIRRGELGAAYSLLAPADQALSPFEQWAALYADTIDLTVTVAPGAAPDTVQVDLTETVRTPDGGQVARRFVGTWEVRWDAARGGWSLGNPRMVATS